jgi:hypothetical protein
VVVFRTLLLLLLWCVLNTRRPTFEQVLRELQSLRAADARPTPALHVVVQPPRVLAGSTPSNKGSDSHSPPVSSNNQVRTQQATSSALSLHPALSGGSSCSDAGTATSVWLIISRLAIRL